MNDWLEYSASGSARNEECLEHGLLNGTGIFGNKHKKEDSGRKNFSQGHSSGGFQINEKSAPNPQTQMAVNDAAKRIRTIYDAYKAMKMSKAYEFEMANKQISSAIRLCSQIESYQKDEPALKADVNITIMKGLINEMLKNAETQADSATKSINSSQTFKDYETIKKAYEKTKRDTETLRGELSKIANYKTTFMGMHL